jgi:hypothetical protein
VTTDAAPAVERSFNVRTTSVGTVAGVVGRWGMSDVLDELKEAAAFTDRVYGGEFIQHRAIAEIESLRERVEELETENFDLNNANVVFKAQSVYHPTNEMIDAAVHCANYHLKYGNNKGWWVLNEIHIFRCEGCGGSGRVPPAITGHFKPLPGSECPDCNGHGWVVREVGDD